MQRHDVESRIQQTIQDQLDDRLSLKHTFRYDHAYAENRDRMKLDLFAVERLAPESHHTPQTILVIQVIFLHELKEIQIPNIFMPEDMRYDRLGKRTLKAIFDTANALSYELFVTDLTGSFYERLVKSRAFQVSKDCVQITADTDLTSDVGSPKVGLGKVSSPSIFDLLQQD